MNALGSVPMPAAPSDSSTLASANISAKAGATAPASAIAETRNRQPATVVSRETSNEKRETVFTQAEGLCGPASTNSPSRETRNEKPETFFIAQRPAEYTQENQAVWQLLFARRMKHLRTVGSSAFLKGIAAIGLEPHFIPDLHRMNRRLEPITGWRAVAVTGFLEPTLFFQCLAELRFPTTVIVRPMEQLDYLPDPDIFHDVFGHVPIHPDPVFDDFLQRFSAI